MCLFFNEKSNGDITRPLWAGQKINQLAD